jgi:AcrR family transcriptional regulator
MPKMGADARRERREQFIRAARRCAATKGYRSVTVDDVCTVAGLSKGAFYTHFESKQDLLLGVLDDDAARSDALIGAIGTSAVGELERSRRFVRGALDRAEEQGEVQMRADLWSEMLADEHVRAALAAAVRRQRSQLSGWIQAGIAAGEIVEVTPNALAAILIALADGLMLHRALDPTAFKWPNIKRAVDALLDGLGA